MRSALPALVLVARRVQSARRWRDLCRQAGRAARLTASSKWLAAAPEEALPRFDAKELEDATGLWSGEAADRAATRARAEAGARAPQGVLESWSSAAAGAFRAMPTMALSRQNCATRWPMMMASIISLPPFAPTTPNIPRCRRPMLPRLIPRAGQRLPAIWSAGAGCRAILARTMCWSICPLSKSGCGAADERVQSWPAVIGKPASATPGLRLDHQPCHPQSLVGNPAEHRCREWRAVFCPKRLCPHRVRAVGARSRDRAIRWGG